VLKNPARYDSLVLLVLKLSAVAVEPETHIAFVGLGSNIEPETNLSRAVAELKKQLKVLCISAAWKAPALGTSGPDFLNAVIKIRTSHSADELKLLVLRPIENALGRVRTGDKNAPRAIDLDILVFDEVVYEEHIWDYAYLAVPLAECNPERQDPISNRSLRELSIEYQKTGNIRSVLKF
jgi:2-amino-4-hydroxy-6-hydroxymethyldihydropteridine diphosphokinase